MNDVSIAAILPTYKTASADKTLPLSYIQNFDKIPQLIWKLFNKASNQLGAFIKLVVFLENFNCNIHVSTISNHGLGMTLFTTKIEPTVFPHIVSSLQ